MGAPSGFGSKRKPQQRRWMGLFFILPIWVFWVPGIFDPQPSSPKMSLNMSHILKDFSLRAMALWCLFISPPTVFCQGPESHGPQRAGRTQHYLTEITEVEFLSLLLCKRPPVESHCATWLWVKRMPPQRGSQVARSIFPLTNGFFWCFLGTHFWPIAT